MKHCFKIFLLFFLGTSFLYGQEIPKPMSPPQMVNDFAEIFDSSQQSELEQMLRNYNDTTSTQIYVVTVTDLQGYAVSDYATRMGEQWGIGQKEKNNGVLILIKPRIGNERGHVFIATGYGVEHILNDARVGRIIDQYMIPFLREEDYYNASRNASIVIMQYLSGEFSADEDAEIPKGALIMMLVFFGLFMYMMYKASKNNNNKGGGGFSGGFGGGFGGGFFGGGSGGFGGGGGSFGGGGGSFGGGGAGRGF